MLYSLALSCALSLVSKSSELFQAKTSDKTCNKRGITYHCMIGYSNFCFYGSENEIVLSSASNNVAKLQCGDVVFFFLENSAKYLKVL